MDRRQCSPMPCARSTSRIVKVFKRVNDEWHEMSIEIHHLLDHKHHIPTVSAWQQAEFGYLSPNGTVEQRVERL